MKNVALIIASFLIVFSILAGMAISDPLNDFPAWYCTLSGKDNGAFEVVFNPDGSLSGVGATKKKGVISLSGEYLYDSGANKFHGTYQILGDFDKDDGSFEGKLGKKRNNFNSKWRSSSGGKYKVKGVTSPENQTINGAFTCKIKKMTKV